MDYLLLDKSRPALLALIGINAISAALYVQAEPLEVQLSATQEYSDNVTKTQNKEDDWLSKVGLKLGQTLTKGAFESSLSADFGFEHYWGDTFGDEVTTEVIYDGRYNFSPSLSWLIKDELTEDVLNSSTPNTPDTRVRKNVFTTGPSYRIAVSAKDDLVLGGQYKQIDFDSNTAIDSKRNTATADYVHRFANELTFTWSNSGEWADLDNETDIETLESEVRLSKRYNDLFASMGVGVTRLTTEQSSGDRKSDEVTGSLNLSYQASAAVGLTYAYNRKLTDSASETVFQIFEHPITIGSSETVLMQEHVAGVNYKPNSRDVFQLKGSSTTEENETTTLEDKEYSAAVSWSHKVNAVWNWLMSSEYTNKTFGGSNAEQDTYEHSIQVNHHWYKNFSSRYYVEYESKDSDGGAAEYDAMTVGVGVDYVPNF